MATGWDIAAQRTKLFRASRKEEVHARDQGEPPVAVCCTLLLLLYGQLAAQTLFLCLFDQLKGKIGGCKTKAPHFFLPVWVDVESHKPLETKSARMPVKDAKKRSEAVFPAHQVGVEFRTIF